MGCGLFHNIEGTWEAKTQQCLHKDYSKNYKQNIDSHNKYTLEFKSNKKVILTYLGTQVLIDENKKTCDVIVSGVYSYNLLGRLRFDFKSHNQYDIKKGSNCEIKSLLNFKSLPANSAYINNPVVVVDKVNNSTLHLGFSAFPKCVNNRMLTVFTKK